MRSRKGLIWLVVVLVILNAATIATIVYHNYNEKKVKEDVVLLNTNGEMINGRYMRQQLDFDNDQVDAFRNANFDFRQQAFSTITAIDVLKLGMFKELQKETPDSIKIKNISDSIGIRHADLKKRTADFYLKIKRICNPGQAVKLEKIFAPLFDNEGVNSQPHHGFQTGGNGQGRGPGWRRFKDSIN